MYDVDGPAFMKRELVRFGTGRSEFTVVHVDLCPFVCFESIGLISPTYGFGTFAVCEDGDGVGEVFVRTKWDMVCSRFIHMEGILSGW